MRVDAITRLKTTIVTIPFTSEQVAGLPVLNHSPGELGIRRMPRCT
jgi:hypothetical protein